MPVVETTGSIATQTLSRAIGGYAANRSGKTALAEVNRCLKAPAVDVPASGLKDLKLM